jgi:hypothetical protein
VYTLLHGIFKIKRGGVIYLDPTAAEEEGKEASVLMAYMPSLSEVTQLDVQGRCICCFQREGHLSWLFLNCSLNLSKLSTSSGCVSTLLSRLLGRF